MHEGRISEHMHLSSLRHMGSYNYSMSVTLCGQRPYKVHPAWPDRVP